MSSFIHNNLQQPITIPTTNPAMVAINNLLFLASTVAAGVIDNRAAANEVEAMAATSATTVETDLKTIDADLKNLTAAVNAWDGTIGNVNPVINTESKLENDLKLANDDTSSSTAFSESDASAILSYIKSERHFCLRREGSLPELLLTQIYPDTLTPDVNSAITALEDKKSKFVSDGVESVVESDLKNIKNETDTLGANLVKKAPADKTSSAKAALSTLDAALQSAINAFAS